MNLNQETDPTQSSQSSRRRVIQLLIGKELMWIVLAYVVAPFVWDSFARIDPAFDDTPRITETGDHHPGDPLNVELIGTESQLESIMQAAGWFAAPALGIESDLKIAADSSILSDTGDRRIEVPVRPSAAPAIPTARPAQLRRVVLIQVGNTHLH